MLRARREYDFCRWNKSVAISVRLERGKEMNVGTNAVANLPHTPGNRTEIDLEDIRSGKPVDLRRKSHFNTSHCMAKTDRQAVNFAASEKPIPSPLTGEG